MMMMTKYKKNFFLLIFYSWTIFFLLFQVHWFHVCMLLLLFDFLISRRAYLFIIWTNQKISYRFVKWECVWVYNTFGGAIYYEWLKLYFIYFLFLFNEIWLELKREIKFTSKEVWVRWWLCCALLGEGVSIVNVFFK